jgi:hypothetical protein
MPGAFSGLMKKDFTGTRILRGIDNNKETGKFIH